MTGFNDTLKNGIRRTILINGEIQEITPKTNEFLFVTSETGEGLSSELNIDFTKCNNAKILIFGADDSGISDGSLTNLHIQMKCIRDSVGSFYPIINNLKSTRFNEPTIQVNNDIATLTFTKNDTFNLIFVHILIEYDFNNGYPILTFIQGGNDG